MRLLEEELAKHSDALEARARELKERERAFEEHQEAAERELAERVGVARSCEA